MRFAQRMISPVLWPLYVCVCTNFVMELIKCSHCSKVQIFAQLEPIAAAIERALMLVLSECYFYLFHFHTYCSTIHKIVLFDSIAYVATLWNDTIENI